MLDDYPMHVVLLSVDLAETRAFYHDQLGLEIFNESDEAITFRPGSTELAVTRSYGRHRRRADPGRLVRERSRRGARRVASERRHDPGVRPAGTEDG